MYIYFPVIRLVGSFVQGLCLFFGAFFFLTYVTQTFHTWTLDSVSPILSAISSLIKMSG